MKYLEDSSTLMLSLNKALTIQEAINEIVDEPLSMFHY